MSSTVSRRSVVGLVWGAPVVLLAVSAPAAAASDLVADGSSSRSSNAISVTSSLVTVASSSPAGVYLSGLISQAGGVVPTQVKLTSRFLSTGTATYTVPATATVTNKQFQFQVTYSPRAAAYSFEITIVPDNDPSVDFAPGGNVITVLVPAFAPQLPPSGGTYTPPPTFAPPTSTPAPTNTGPNCVVQRSIAGSTTKLQTSGGKTFCD
jgi:hypothetical protein